MMPNSEYRNKRQIIYDILEILIYNGLTEKKTNLMYKSNTNSGQINKYLSLMNKHGLIDIIKTPSKTKISITKRGIDTYIDLRYINVRYNYIKNQEDTLQSLERVDHTLELVKRIYEEER